MDEIQCFDSLSLIQRCRLLIFNPLFSSYNREQVKSDAISKVDSNGDKSISVEDAKYYWKKFKSIMTKNLPSAGGFSLGFMYGVIYN